MDIQKRPDGYWITHMPDSPDAGPYDRKVDAQSDRKGLRQFFKHEDERDFFTVDRRGSKEEGITAPANSDPRLSRDSVDDSAQLLRTSATRGS
jgi:hypothetical protein